jgi:hypothetical protein
MAENGSIPISDGSSQNGAESEADAPSSQTAAEPQTEPPPRQPRTERAHAFTFSTWLLEGVVGLCEELQHNDLSLPQNFWTHAYAARREALLAARALIDTAITRCETDASQREEQSSAQRGRVDIE